MRCLLSVYKASLSMYKKEVFTILARKKYIITSRLSIHILYNNVILWYTRFIFLDFI